MRKRKIWVGLTLGFIISLGASTSSAQFNSVLRSGAWYKVGVTESGIYKMDGAFLASLGLDPANIDPRNLRLYGNGGGGMLPQANSMPRKIDLVENAIAVVGEEDGRFDPGDYVVFYGNTPDLASIDQASGRLFYRNNLYSDTTFYFITAGDEPGLRISTSPSLQGSFPSVTDFDDVIIHELDDQSLIGTGREWYGERFSENVTTNDFQYPMQGILLGEEMIVVSAVMAQTREPASFDVALNGINLGRQEIEEIPDATYDIKGVNVVDTFKVVSNILNDLGSGLTVDYTYNPAFGVASNGFLNFFTIQFKRRLQLYGEITRFRSLNSLRQPTTNYRMEGADNSVSIWNITDPTQPVAQEFSLSGGVATFNTPSISLQEFVAFNSAAAIAPLPAGRVANQNIHNAAVPEAIVVAHEDFLDQANRLAAFRRQNDGLDVLVVTIDQVYNEFSSGMQDVSAVRDMAKYFYDRAPDRLRYLLLFGDASYDYKRRTIVDNNFVPIYEARNSMHPILSYSSDDYFGFMDDNEGLWLESDTLFSTYGDHVLDIGVGRLPVTTADEARIVVDKLIRYVDSESALGDWKNEIYFVADDGDNNIHQRDADRLATFVDGTYPEFNANKIYLDAFPQEPTPRGELAPTVTQTLTDAVEKGAFMVNFTGHGNENFWMEEEVLDRLTIENWDNRNQLPIFVTATCEFGRYDNPSLVSGGELLILNENGGAIALVTTSRPVFSNTNFRLNEAFYNHVFEKIDGEYPRLGDIIQTTKNESLAGAVNRNFALLGDPMMRLAYPEYDIRITRINGDSVQNEVDTLKALNLITIEGEVVNSLGDRMTGFDGTLAATVFDKPDLFQTLGNESSPSVFEQRTSVIFRGDVSVNDGTFSVNFVVPKNISYLINEGKISLYANTTDFQNDANGANIEVLIGGSEENPNVDDAPPNLDLYLNDEDFRSGDQVSPNNTLIVNLEDENGITITNAGVGQDLVAILEGEEVTETFVLNEFYRSELDTYQRGQVVYPLKDLPEGRYALTVKAFDTHNNSTEGSIEFFVSESAKIGIKNVLNYPNPFSSVTTFRFNHDRIGETVTGTLRIYSHAGELVRSINFVSEDGSGTVDGITWDRTNGNGTLVINGIYIYRIELRSENDGSTNSAAGKLIVIN